MEDELWPSRKICWFFGISAPTLGEWVKAGFPKQGKNQYPLKACFDWLKKTESEKVPGGSDAKRRKEMAQAQLAELKLERDRGLLIERDKVMVTFGTLVSESKTRLLAIPKRLSTELAALNDSKAVEVELMKEIRRILVDMEKPLKEKRGKKNVDR